VKGEQMSDISAVDHLVIGGSDLYDLERWWKDRAGVAAQRGGSHPGVGTWNSLVGVGPSTYVELIAPDPTRPAPGQPRPFGVDRLRGPSLVTFAVAVSDIERSAEMVAEHGIEPGEIRSMSRIRPDGVVLSWRLAVPPEPVLAGVMPFLIEWAPESHHPCDTLVQYLDFVDLILFHPDPVPIGNAIAAATDTKIVVSEGPVEICARFHTDGGIVDVSSVHQ
jgi:hypothetical protein